MKEKKLLSLMFKRRRASCDYLVKKG